MPPYFSVVTPSYNQGRFFEGCIQSVLNQQDPDFEHIVFDNCSTDETRDVLARHPHIRAFFEKDRGQADALNKGFAQARGEIICWLNADDQYLPGAFAALRDAFEDPAVQVVMGNAQQDNFDGGPRSVEKGRLDRREDLVTWWERKFRLPQPAIFFRRSLLARAGPLREDLHYILDWEFWFRLSAFTEFRSIDRDFALQQLQPEAKTVLDREVTFQERDRVFLPHLGLIKDRTSEELLTARRRTMAWRYRRYAGDALDRDRALSGRLLRLSVHEDWKQLLDPQWWLTLGAWLRRSF